ncbi:hypothetical protein TGAM01_v211182 [Trichoderma gamsii]|uniref:Uncharacterized protein n=1 Tax=Trichoderma gamsii TaxID=398673 RepID=A0A2P4Z6N8_9HYPO|nr:hypothetical protein TGAM01_v211182 [Trichoderma gamsii]PON19954.1 hypothetical protein TGAM01_v211182 [Trichoderma gamsii]
MPSLHTRAPTVSQTPTTLTLTSGSPPIFARYTSHISAKRDMCTAERTPTSQTRLATERTVKAPREKPKKNSSSPGW